METVDKCLRSASGPVPATLAGKNDDAPVMLGRGYDWLPKLRPMASEEDVRDEGSGLYVILISGTAGSEVLL